MCIHISDGALNVESETEQGMDHLLGSKQDKPKIWKVYTCRKAKGVESELVRS